MKPSTLARIVDILGFAGIIAVLCGLFLCAGCGPTLREAIQNKSVSNTRTSGVGILLRPFGEGPESPKVTIGFGQTQHTFNPTAEGEIRAPAVMNRTGVRGPFGSDITDTTAIGDIGDEMEKGGKTISETIKNLHPRSGEFIPTAPL